ncbi:MAG: GerMN domain-containing protein [Clostridiaceae bacterium]
MKKSIFLVLYGLVLTLVLMACNQYNNTTRTAKEYYPMKSNSVFVYEGYGNEYASYTRYTDYTDSIKQQLRTNNGGTETVNVYENTNDGVKIIFTKNECYYRESFLNDTANKDEYLIKNPIKVGTTWTLPDGSKRSITSVNTTVSTDLKEYTRALEITTTNDSSKTQDYYVKDIGLVKSVYKSYDGFTVTSSLKEIKMDTPLTQVIRYYYPDSNVENVWYVDKQIDFYTNDITRVKLVKEFTNPPDGLSCCIGLNTITNSLDCKNTDKMIHVDFSSNFVKDLNAGSSYEQLCLTSIVDTIGRYYSNDKVCITLDGKPYESGHIIMQPGQAFTVKFDGIKEWPQK